MLFSAFSIFVMSISAFLAIAIAIFNPFANLLGKSRGKTGKEIGEKIEKVVYVLDSDGKKKLDEDGNPEINWSGISSNAGGWCTGACLFLAILMPISYLITFVIEPIYIISAITKGIGSVYVAYAMLAIILYLAISKIVAFIGIIQAAFKVSEPEIIPGINAPQEERLAYEIRKKIKEEEAAKKVEVTTASWLKSLFFRFVYALPDLYLVYLVVTALSPTLK